MIERESCLPSSRPLGGQAMNLEILNGNESEHKQVLLTGIRKRKVILISSGDLL